MSTFAVNLNGYTYVPVIAEDFAFLTLHDERVRGAQPMPPSIQYLTFTKYNGVDVSQFIGEAGASPPAPQIIEDDYWIPSKNVYTVHKLLQGNVAPAAPPEAARNVYLVVPIAVNYFLPVTLIGTGMEAFPLFIGDSFYFAPRSKLNDQRNKAQGAMGGAEVVLHFVNYRGRAKWAQLTTPGALPAVIPTQDFYLPIKYIAAVFRIRNQLWT